ncbi:MAG: DUF4351 domain-containing protein [Cyanomargarita calcarea GSE-NOS-MK-12-04C]|uniref:DUF4351 domain-containing protein n=1 Tax=Cyanomargarita calcarea GSE-NOS-MK-12-04C TaxID=2839659 RepID=A0A951QUF8_9CYAN|nr:DUF4351 domain-containing protein [Cyanomargarita calcarea GSE-NOS-MK-12-04C]
MSKHLRTQQTLKEAKQRKHWKFSLIRRLYDLGLSEQDIRKLYKFIDWVMILPKGLENEFWEDFKQFEKERKVTYITNAERIGYERGELAEGRSLILLLLNTRIGEVPQQNRTAIESLTLKKLEALGQALLNFTSTDDLVRWLQQNQNS